MKETVRLGLFELSSSGNKTSISIVDIDKEERKRKGSLKKKLKKKNQRNTHKK